MYQQRLHHTQRVVTRRLKTYYATTVVDLSTIDGRTRGRARKTKPWDCGRPRCRLCSSPRVTHGYPTRKEYMADYSLREQLADL